MMNNNCASQREFKIEYKGEIMDIELPISEKEYNSIRSRYFKNRDDELEYIVSKIFIIIMRSKIENISTLLPVFNGITIPYYKTNDGIYIFGSNSLLGKRLSLRIEKVINIRNKRLALIDYKC